MVLINIGKVIARIARWMFVIWCEKYWPHIFFKGGLVSEGILILAPLLKALVVKNSVLHDFGFGKVSPAKQL